METGLYRSVFFALLADEVIQSITSFMIIFKIGDNEKG